MANPFRFGQVVSGELFCNRRSEIKQVTQNLSGGQSIVLYSQRRHGKTSLIYAASSAIKVKEILFGYVDLFSCNSTEKILIAIARAAAKAILDDLKSIEKFLKSTTHFFNRIRFSVKFDTNDAGSISVLPELSSKATSIDSLADALNGLNTYLSKNQKRAALILDEFQQVIKVDSNLEAEFRTVIQQQDRISFAFLGSRTHLLKDMFINKNRPFYHAAKIMELGPIADRELADFIKNRFGKIGISISTPMALGVAEIVKGHPDYAQRLCSHIFDILETTTINEGHIEEGMKQMLISLTPSFRGVFEELPLRESQVLTILAENGPLKIFPSKLIQAYDMGTPSLHKALSNLIKKDLIIKGEDKSYDIIDNFLSEWLRMLSKSEGHYPQ
jgi:AAA+ ATPase superfamily predicted ATPase